jgi:hypothetical protein
VRKTSLEAVQRIIGRAVTDSTFRNLLQTNPDEVFAGRDVTAEETVALKGMNWDAVGSVSRDLDARISRMGVLHASCK